VKGLEVLAHRSQTILVSGACIGYTAQVHVVLMELMATLMIRYSEIIEGCLRSKEVTIPSTEVN
jgi:hypothetical protein